MDILGKIKEFVVHCGTGIEGQTWDVVRVGGGLGVLAIVGMSLVHLIMHGVFDAMAVGTGIAATLGATGAGVGMKKGTEPGETQ